MKNFLTVSLFAVMAVTAANAEIASTTYVDNHIASDAVNTVVSGSANGTIAVDGTDVAVKGLGTAAYTASTAYDAAGAAAAALAEAKAYADTAETDAVAAAKSYTDGQITSISEGNDAAISSVNQAISDLDETKADNATTLAGYGIIDAYTKAETNTYVTDNAVNTVVSGSANGTIAVDGTDVAVKGLGTAAYTASTAYATAAQGALADSAMQETELKKLQSYTTNGCGNSGVMCSLVSVGGTITWEKVNQGS